jgi:hypothetical protein
VIYVCVCVCKCSGRERIVELPAGTQARVFCSGGLCVSKCQSVGTQDAGADRQKKYFILKILFISLRLQFDLIVSFRNIWNSLDLQRTYYH